VVALVTGALLGGGLFVAAGPFQPIAQLVAETTITTTTAVPTTAPPSTTTTVAPTTTTAPVTTTTTVPPKGWLTIQGVGDTNYDPDYIPAFRTEGYDFALERLYGLFWADDLTVANLECSASNLGTALPKEFTFRCDPDALPIAAYQGIDVANLANNHGQDFGTEAMLDSRANVAGAGIAPVGVGENLDEAIKPAIFETNGWTVAVVGFGGVVPGESWLATNERPGMASGDDTDLMVRAVQAADEVADLVVVTIHWMWELETEPRFDDRARAEAMIDAGADVIFGHHPHRLGDLEFIDGKPVFWTLGNFVWPRLSDAGATTAIGRAVVSPEGDIDACLIPVFIRTSGRPEPDGSITCFPGGD
jgi:poly-gamma-glutamate synthesis protein (capsule biosynthesis protein)